VIKVAPLAGHSRRPLWGPLQCFCAGASLRRQIRPAWRADAHYVPPGAKVGHGSKSAWRRPSGAHRLAACSPLAPCSLARQLAGLLGAELRPVSSRGCAKWPPGPSHEAVPVHASSPLRPPSQRGAPSASRAPLFAHFVPNWPPPDTQTRARDRPSTAAQIGPTFV